jgi:muramoyltetrapeptide carboxypeptidase
MASPAGSARATRAGWIRPPRLAPGDRVAVIAPASPVPRTDLERGAAELARHGLRPEWDDGLFERHLFLAGTDARRRAEWERALVDPEIRGVFAARGGAGSYRLLPAPDGLAAAVRSRPRVFCGFSDLTFLHAALGRQRVVSFYGPMVAWDLARTGGYDEPLFRRLLFGAEPGGALAPAGVEALRPGRAEGPLVGGCLSLLSASAGTPEALDATGAIVLIEDEQEAPYRLDRFLHHLRRSGALAGARGVVLGEFPQCEPSPPDDTSARQVMAEFFADFPGPVVWGFPAGHTRRANLTLPLGTWARLDGDAGSLELAEPAVL